MRVYWAYWTNLLFTDLQ